MLSLVIIVLNRVAFVYFRHPFDKRVTLNNVIYHLLFFNNVFIDFREYTDTHCSFCLHFKWFSIRANLQISKPIILNSKFNDCVTTLPLIETRLYPEENLPRFLSDGKPPKWISDGTRKVLRHRNGQKFAFVNSKRQRNDVLLWKNFARSRQEQPQ